MSLFAHEIAALRAQRTAAAELHGAGLFAARLPQLLAQRAATDAACERVFKYATAILIEFAPLDVSWESPHYHSTPNDGRYTGFEHKTYLNLARDGSLRLIGCMNGNKTCTVELGSFESALFVLGWWRIGSRLYHELHAYGARDAGNAVANFTAAFEEIEAT